MKHQYIAYGLSIESDYPLPVAQEGFDPELPLIHIHQAQPGLDWAGLENVNDRGDFLVAHLDEVISFFVDSGQSITMAAHLEAVEESDYEELTHLMRSMSAGFALALLLRQRGYLVLHASVLQKGDKTIGFVGESGWGKSTLAELFSQRGYHVLSDDVGVIDKDGEQIQVFPGHPLIKLRDNSVKGLLNGEIEYFECEPDGRVYRKTGSVDNQEPVQLHRLYLLTPTFSDEVRLEEVSPQQKVLTLMRHTHGAHLLTRGDYKTALLRQCSAVVKRVPTRVLHRKKGLDHLPEVRQVVEHDLDLVDHQHPS